MVLAKTSNGSELQWKCHLFLAGKMEIRHPAGEGGDTSIFLPQMPVSASSSTKWEEKFPNIDIDSEIRSRKAGLSPSCSVWLSLLWSYFRSGCAESSLLKTTAALVIANAYRHTRESPPSFNLTENITLLKALFDVICYVCKLLVTFQGVGKDEDGVSEVSLLKGFFNKAEKNCFLFLLWSELFWL